MLKSEVFNIVSGYITTLSDLRMIAQSLNGTAICIHFWITVIKSLFKLNSFAIEALLNLGKWHFKKTAS